MCWALGWVLLMHGPPFTLLPLCELGVVTPTLQMRKSRLRKGRHLPTRSHRYGIVTLELESRSFR